MRRKKRAIQVARAFLSVPFRSVLFLSVPFGAALIERTASRADIDSRSRATPVIVEEGPSTSYRDTPPPPPLIVSYPDSYPRRSLFLIAHPTWDGNVSSPIDPRHTLARNPYRDRSEGIRRFSRINAGIRFVGPDVLPARDVPSSSRSASVLSALIWLSLPSGKEPPHHPSARPYHRISQLRRYTCFGGGGGEMRATLFASALSVSYGVLISQTNLHSNVHPRARALALLAERRADLRESVRRSSRRRDDSRHPFLAVGRIRFRAPSLVRPPNRLARLGSLAV